MTPRKAIRILQLSPFYFQLSPADRLTLVREFCAGFDTEPDSRRDQAANFSSPIGEYGLNVAHGRD